MSATYSAEATALLQSGDFRLRKVLEITNDLFNADVRQWVDVSDLVVRWGRLTGASSIKSTSWEIPSFSPSLSNIDNYFSEDHAESVWTALGKAPDECWVRLRVQIKLSTGAYETLRTYYGKIFSVVPKDSGLVDIQTRHAVDEALAQGITKQSGDELQVLGSNW